MARNKLKDQPAGSSGWTKFAYDAIARQIWSYVGYSTETENWDQAGNLAVSIVFEQTQTWFDDASNVVETDFYQRFHTASATITGALAGPSSSTVPARISFTAMYPDGIGRTVNTANYGTNGDADSFSRSPTAPTASSATVLVTIVIFNDRGEPYQTVDPKGQVNQTTLDNAARKTQFIQNLTSGAGPDQNITTNWTFDTGGHVSGLHAINAETGEQVTAYSFGVTVAGGSTINSNDVLRVTTMPDGGATVKEVNRQGEVILVTDARGVVRQLSRDLLGRPTLDAVVTLPDSVDGAVMAIGLSYEVRSLVEKITSYAAATGPGSTVVNEVQNLYNDFWQLYQQFQEHSGAVNTGTSKSVQFAFTDGAGNSSRPRQVTFPSGTLLNLGYGASGSPDDLLSRIASLALGSDTVATYNFLGVGTPVIVEYPDPDIAYTLATGSGAGLYAGLDIFGRVINCLWQQTVGDVTTALASLGYGYDFAGNRQWRQDNVAESLGKYFDEFYGLDGVYRLTGLARGQLTGTPPTGVTGQTFGEDWTLDPTGNWNEYQQLSDASTVTLDQTRTASAVNEITAIDVTTPSDAPWAQPGYDSAGNMTTMPQPNSPGNPYASTFDAWQRMRFLYDMTVPTAPVQVQENQYDGRNFRVRRIIPTESGTETRDFYHSDSWQVLQEYVAGYVDRQYVWGLRYIDDLILRDRSVASPGALDERHYALQDDNWNVVAIYNAGTSAIDQRFAYSAYGILLPLNPDFTAYSGSGYDWTVLYTGRELDIAAGVYCFRTRFFAALPGVFLGRDRARGGLSVYQYCSGNPPSRVDPLGLVDEAPTSANLSWRDFLGTPPADSTGEHASTAYLSSIKAGTHHHICDKVAPKLCAKAKHTVVVVKGGQSTAITEPCEQPCGECWKCVEYSFDTKYVVEFDRTRSYRTKGIGGPDLSGDQALLAHERLHLSIAEHVAHLGTALSRGVRGHGLSCSRNSAIMYARNDWQEKADKLAANMAKLDRVLQKRYDDETEHSQNAEAQSEWQKKIDQYRASEDPSDWGPEF